MTLDKKSDLTSMDNLPAMNSILSDIRSQAMSVKHTSTVPTVSSIAEGQIIIYDSAAVRGVDDGTKRLYVVTAKGNLGYVALT